MSAVSLMVAAGALLLSPWLWSGLIAGARRAALGWRAREPAGDRGEKAVLAIMLAPVFLGAALLMAPPALGPASAPPPLLDLIEWSGLAPQEALEARPTGLNWPLAIALAVWALYGLGVLRFAAPLLAAHVRVGHVLMRATPDAQRANVLLSDLTTTPLAVSRGRIVVPRTLLAALSAAQIDMIVAHERRHHERGDIVYYALLAWLEVAFWFNPFVRGQINTCRLAAELDCDASVTRVAPHMRRTYAQTLLEVLKHTAGSALPCAPAVFSTRTFGDNRMRILHIMKQAPGARKRTPWLAYAAAVALAAPFGMVQLALAQSAGAPVATPAAAVAPRFSQAPLSGRVSSAFGQRVDPFTQETRQHSGVDIVADEGATIVAPADGRVIRIAHNQGGYGNVLEIDHGGGYVLRYAQLSAFDVREGDSVRAGQVIARVGSSGRATGPHLHLEVWRDGVVTDPASVLTLPN